MPLLNTEELDEIHAALVMILRDAGLGWVADQAADEVAFGRIVVRPPVRRASGVSRRAADQERPLQMAVELSRAQFVEKGAAIAAVPFEALERVQVLVRALRRVLNDSEAMERELATFLAAERERGVVRGLSSVRSAPESGEERVLLSQLDRVTPESRERLLNAIEQLSARIAE